MSLIMNEDEDCGPETSANADTYYYDRAEIELERAMASDHPGVVKAHYFLAGLYLDRFYGGQEAVEDQSQLAVESQPARTPHHLG